MSLLFKNTLATLILLLISSITYSQDRIDKGFEQEVNLGALKLVEKYQFLYDMRKGRDYDNFVALFEDENSEMNNDIMPDNNVNKSVRVNDYINLFDDNYKEPMQVQIEPYEISSIRDYKNKTGELSVFAKKKISGFTKKMINYKDTFDVEIIIKFDLNLKKHKYQIKKVALIESKGKYFVIDGKVKTTLKDAVSMSQKHSLLVNGNRISLDSEGRYVLKNLTRSNKFKIESIDENIVGSAIVTLDNIDEFDTSKEGDKNTRQIVFKKPLFYSGVGISLNPLKSSPVKYTGASKHYSLSNNLSYDVGVDLGIHLNKDYNSRYNFYFKTGVHYKNLDFTINLAQYSYATLEIDPDYYEYERIHSFTDVSETINLSYFVLPVAFNTTYSINEFILNFEVGTQWHYSLASNYSSKANALYSGYYKDLFNITFAENGVYDFGSYDIQGEGDLEPLESMFSTYYSIGIARKISKRTLLSLSFLNNYGFSNMFEENTKEYSGDSEELNSVTNISNEFSLSEIFLNLSLKYKF